jgi:hypothetical protein
MKQAAFLGSTGTYSKTAVFKLQKNYLFFPRGRIRLKMDRVRYSYTVFGNQGSSSMFLYNLSWKTDVPLCKIEKLCKVSDQHEKPSDADPQH